MSARPEWMVPGWMRDELKEARLRLGSMRRYRERALRTGKAENGDFVKSIDAMIAIRARVVDLVEKEFAAIEAEKGGA